MVKPESIVSIGLIGALVIGGYFLFKKFSGKPFDLFPEFSNPFERKIPIENVPDVDVLPKGSRLDLGDPYINKEAYKITFANNSSIQRSFKASPPLGQGKLLGVRGLPLAANAIGRTQPTYTGVLTTSRGSRAIAGSAALFKRLENNLRLSSNASVSRGI